MDFERPQKRQPPRRQDQRRFLGVLSFFISLLFSWRPWRLGGLTLFSSLGVLAVCFFSAVAGCSGGERRFALREPVWRDTDLEPRSIPCERRPSQKEPDHISCAPERYVSPLAWDGIDNTIFRPFAKVFAVDPAREAVDVNALDEVPDSAWFIN